MLKEGVLLLAQNTGGTWNAATQTEQEDCRKIFGKKTLLNRPVDGLYDNRSQKRLTDKQRDQHKFKESKNKLNVCNAKGMRLLHSSEVIFIPFIPALKNGDVSARVKMMTHI